MSPLALGALSALSLRTTLPLGLLLMVLLSSCTKTVVETVPGPTVYDTLHGPTLMRFLSMSPDARPIYLKRSREGSAPIFLTAPAASYPQYAVVPDTGAMFYLFRTINTCYDSVPVPAYHTFNSLHTVALFRDSLTDRFAISDDSAKLHPAPAAKCYIRFVNGIAQYPPAAPQLYLDLDVLGQSPFLDGGQPVPVAWGSLNDYTLIPAGIHTVFVRAEQKSLGSTSQQFMPGSYYTVRACGQYPPTLQVAIDED